MNRPRLALVSRGDPLVPYLFDALERRYPIAGRISPELTPAQRARVAATTFRPARDAWAQRYLKSPRGHRLRSTNSARALTALPGSYDLVFQVHALAGRPRDPYVLYVDCTHRQSAQQWPRWNPLSGRSLRDWYDHERRLYQGAAHVFSFCTETTRTLAADYAMDADRITTTGAGINLRSFPGPADRPSTPRLLFVGNDFERKGGRLLLDAFTEVRRSVPEATLTLVGDRPQVVLPAGVRALGHIDDRRRLAQIYRTSTAFTLPSYFEPYGLVLLEAMAFGLPVVVTRTCGIPDIVRDGVDGLLLDVGDRAALVETLTAVLTDPGRAASMGAAGRRRAEQDFGWDQVVERMNPGMFAAVRMTPFDENMGAAG